MKLAEARVQGVFARDSFGRFISQCEAAADRTGERIGDVGANAARAAAPTRTGALRASIKNVSSGRNGRWECGTDHWHFVEYGTRAHQIVGKMSFDWAGGHFVWSDPKYRNFNQIFDTSTGSPSAAFVWHPGTKAQPFMRPSYDAASAAAMAIAREEYPG